MRIVFTVFGVVFLGIAVYGLGLRSGANELELLARCITLTLVGIGFLLAPMSFDKV